MENKINNRIANASAVVVILASIAVAAFMLSDGNDVFVYIIAAVNLIAGPACLIGYIREVRRGVFSDDEDE